MKPPLLAQKQIQKQFQVQQQLELQISLKFDLSFMHQVSTHDLSSSQKSFLDDCSSMSSSTVTRRISRKKDGVSASKRSISRNSSENSLAMMDLSKFYVKMTLGKDEKTVEPNRPAILKRSDENTRLKRRSPTPTLGHLRNKQANKTAKKEQLEQIQGDILIAQLQRKLDSVKQQNTQYQKRMLVFEKDLKAKAKKIQELQTKNALLAEKEEISAKKLVEFQQIVNSNENSLNEARSNLEKLRGIIKKNRCNELEAENNKLRKENGQLKNQLRMVQGENIRNKEVISQLQNNLSLLQRQNERLSKGMELKEKNLEIQKLKQIIATSKSQKEEKLEQVIKEKKDSEHRLKLRAEKLQINLNYLHRKKNEEIDKLKEKHNTDLDKMRSKLCMVHNKCRQLMLQCEKLKNNGGMFSSVQLQRRSLNIDTTRQSEDFFLFDLSP